VFPKRGKLFALHFFHQKNQLNLKKTANAVATLRISARPMHAEPPISNPQTHTKNTWTHQIKRNERHVHGSLVLKEVSSTLHCLTNKPPKRQASKKGKTYVRDLKWKLYPLMLSMKLLTLVLAVNCWGMHVGLPHWSWMQSEMNWETPSVQTEVRKIHKRGISDTNYVCRGNQKRYWYSWTRNLLGLLPRKCT